MALGTAGLVVLTVTLSIQGICDNIEQSQLEARTSPHAPRWVAWITRQLHWMAAPSVLSSVTNFVLAGLLARGQVLDPLPGYAMPAGLVVTVVAVCWLERHDDHLAERLHHRAQQEGRPAVARHGSRPVTTGP